MRTIISLRRIGCVVAGFLTLGLTLKTFADQVDMKNGDRYVGQVISLSPDSLVLKNEILGTIKLPREKVAQLTFGTNVVATATLRPATNALPAALPAGLAPKAATLARSQSASSTNVMRQVQEQFLRDAPPAAKAKYEELAGGFLSGQVSESQIRAEAQSAADQLKRLKAELGADVGDELDGYLTILESFLGETKAAPAAVTPPAAKPKPSAGSNDD
jgi:hypothetical protein